jgi:hypothetical protein
VLLLQGNHLALELHQTVDEDTRIQQSTAVAFLTTVPTTVLENIYSLIELRLCTTAP